MQLLSKPQVPQSHFTYNQTVVQKNLRLRITPKLPLHKRSQSINISPISYRSKKPSVELIDQAEVERQQLLAKKGEVNLLEYMKWL